MDVYQEVGGPIGRGDLVGGCDLIIEVILKMQKKKSGCWGRVGGGGVGCVGEWM